MNILFLTIVGINDIAERGIYTDLMRYFRDEGHHVCIVCPKERRHKQKTIHNISDGVSILKVRTLNIQKSSLIEKGLATLLIEKQFLSAIKKYLHDIKFDLVIYSTPPITFTNVISYIKTKDNAKSYLLLKDIFPQNAVDLKMIKENGLIHRYFKDKEKKLYQISDHIGCMSPANVRYIIKHNQVDPGKVEVNPNSLFPVKSSVSLAEKMNTRQEFNIPSDTVVFVYGGNLGKPQGIDFLIAALNSNKDRGDLFFLIVGEGTEYYKIENWVGIFKPKNVLLLKSLPKSTYDSLLLCCDVGMIFLDRKFTIPNFPSRLLSYLEFKIPVIAATDSSTDLGEIMEKNDFGKWLLIGELDRFNETLDLFIADPDKRVKLGENGYQYMIDNYQVKHSYNTVMQHFLDV